MRKEVNSPKKEVYISPEIKIIEVEIEQNIFAGSGDLPGMPGEDW